MADGFASNDKKQKFGPARTRCELVKPVRTVSGIYMALLTKEASPVAPSTPRGGGVPFSFTLIRLYSSTIFIHV